MDTIEIDKFFTVKEAVRYYPNLFHTFKILLAIDDDKAAQAVSIATGVCSDCHDWNIGCQCGNDE